MIISTTPSVDGRSIIEHICIVGAEFIMEGLMANIRESLIASAGEARKAALEEVQTRASSVGADAIVGLRIDYTAIPTDDRTLLMVTASGTAVKLA